MGRKDDIVSMASLVGNAAAHIALLPESKHALIEVRTYTTDAYEIAVQRSWNINEAELFREKAERGAKAEIRKRIKRYRFDEKRYVEFVARAEEYIKNFMERELHKVT